MRDSKFEYIFTPDKDGIYRNSDGTILADFLLSYDIFLDDDVQFCRIIRLLENCRMIFEYRAYSCMRIRINILLTKNL